MADILRTWGCLNDRCGTHFEAWEANPACPSCGCVRVTWVPGGGHVGGDAAKSCDAELRALADVFRMTDMNSAERGRAAKKVVMQPAADQSQKPITFAPGFAAVADPIRAVCVPSASPINVPVKTSIGQSLPRNRIAGQMAGHTSFEGKHSGSGGGRS